jgi:uncharacterized protein
MPLNRRQMLGGTVMTGAAALTASSGLLGTGVAAAAPTSAAQLQSSSRYRANPLFPPLRSKSGDLLALPAEFSYEVVSASGQTDIHDGTGTVIGKTPDRPDGTTSVESRGRNLRLIQNHENNPGAVNKVLPVVGTVYDAGAVGGGCTVIETTGIGQRLSEWVGLSGTINNCAGGPTPWGSWLSCEETELQAGAVTNGATLQKDHGYVFEVFADTPGKQSPLPIKAWGRAPFEAAVVGPWRRRVYITEDASNPNGLLYRWTAQDGYKLKPYIAQSLQPNDGTLEALIVLTADGSVLPDLAYVTAAQIGRPFATKWISVPDRQASGTSMRKQFTEGQITRSKKLEGAWGDSKGLYFAASYAFGPTDLPANATKHDGQMWHYDYSDETLTLVAYFPYNEVLRKDTPDWETTLGLSLDLAFDGPDNVHISPYGSLVIAEDGNTAQHLLSWTKETGAQAIARNLIVLEQSALGGNVYSEMTGPNFSPNGSVLFANVQEPGHTFAITGPWKKYLG